MCFSVIRTIFSALLLLLANYAFATKFRAMGDDDNEFLHRCGHSPCGASVSTRYTVLCSPNSVPFFPSSVHSVGNIGFPGLLAAQDMGRWIVEGTGTLEHDRGSLEGCDFL